MSNNIYTKLNYWRDSLQDLTRCNRLINLVLPQANSSRVSSVALAINASDIYTLWNILDNFNKDIKVDVNIVDNQYSSK